MTLPRALFRLLLASTAAAGVACSDDGLGDPNRANIIDTVTIGSLTGTPILTPSGYAVENGAVRTDLTTQFDFAYNVETDGRRVFLPKAALGLPSATTADPGLQRRDESFDGITVARSNGYVTEEAVPVQLGERYVVRSRIVCSASVPYYAKLEIIGFEDSLVHLKVLANTNCGFKGLEPGLPDR
ncbi:MAG TPA: hypothetical protein VEB59_00235 [Gemmatimonadales bacterium]|nr:hypothetical protein [Gemmatimonadales bacterium]